MQFTVCKPLFVLPYQAIETGKPKHCFTAGHSGITTKILRIMKVTAFFLFVGFMHVQAAGYGQGITLNVKDKPLEEVFKEIRKQTGFQFFYSDKALEGSRKVSLSVRGLGIEEVLKKCFEGQGLEFSIKDKTIVIRRKVLSSANTENKMPPIDVKGRVIDSEGKPVIATVAVKGTNKAVSTNENGEFFIKDVPDNATLVVSGVSIETFEVAVKGKSDLAVLKAGLKINEMNSVQVTINTGYQQVPKERATGSFDFLNSELLNRRIGSNVLDRLEGAASAVLFPNKKIPGLSNESPITIRGRSTIFANARPLIVIDNFPYDGDINNINPNDVESITILKDAAAASIWGAYSGNGVIVITTKKAKVNQSLKIDMIANLTVGGKPDLYYDPNFLSAADFIDIEKFLFSKGFYDADLTNSNTRPVISPVVEMLAKRRSGALSAADSTLTIESLINNDIRRDFDKYIFKNSVSQQYFASISTGGKKGSIYLSLGYDNNAPVQVNNRNERYTINLFTSFSPLKNFEFSSGFYLFQGYTRNNNIPSSIIPQGGKSVYYPYATLADEAGNPLAVPYYYRLNYIDTTGSGMLLDWKYRPLEEIKMADNVMFQYDVRINPSFRYTVLPGLNAEVKFQYEIQLLRTENYHNENTFFARDLINRFTQTGNTSVLRPVPLGGILEQASVNLTSKSIRPQLTFNKLFSRHEINALVGFEQKEVKTTSTSSRLYGYIESNLSAASSIDYLTNFPQWQNIGPQTVIPSGISNTWLNDEFISYFGNAAYTYNRRYIFSASARLDQSNLFGVNTNQKGKPFWSTGIGWIISNEDFYRLKSLSYLKLRATYGYNGNIDRTTTGITTLRFLSSLSVSGLPQASIASFPNPDLRWEKIKVFNLGIDFEFLSKVLLGSIEYYNKRSSDLIGDAPLAASTGIANLKRNVADMKNWGIDVQLTSKNIDKEFKWFTDLLFSYNIDKVTNYNSSQFTNFTLAQSGAGFTSATLVPLVGKPLYAIYSFKSAGLDASGNPQGYLNKQISNNYTSIINSKEFDELTYSGPARPVYFGGIMNRFNYKNFSLSVNVTYKLGYYFRRNSIDYNSLFNSWIGHSDYSMRWQKPGDELITNIPALIYPNSIANRDNFYTYSDALVEKGDHFRIQDVRLSYDLKRHLSSSAVNGVELFVYINNVGIIWKANNADIDPDYVPISGITFPNPRSYSFGVKASF